MNSSMATTMTADSSILPNMENKKSSENSFSSSDSSSTLPVTSVSTVFCSSKRKRPPKIEIPNVLREIQREIKSTFRDCTQDDAFSFAGNGVGVSSIKGKKKFMEDTHKIVSFPQGNTYKAFFGVYDGHGGNKAAEFVADNLHTNILNMLENCSETTTKVEAVKTGYLNTDQDFLKQGLGSGACCVTALIEEKEIVISNLGDCRAVLGRGGMAEALTKDHRAGREDERQRIENKGGFVTIRRETWRVHGILSVSRSIGDAHLKDWVLAEPDTKIIQLAPDMDFLILASDGLWEEVSNQEAVDTVMRVCVPGKKLGPIADLQKEFDEEYGCVSTSPSPKLKRVSLVKQQKGVSQSPMYKKSVDDRWNKSEDGFASENESPPTKARRISLFKRGNIKTHSPIQETNKPATGGLVAACEELIKLAVSRGSLDDITVMIIDLNYFRCNTNS